MAKPAIEVESSGHSVRVSNPDPVFVPVGGDTELDLLDSYLAVSGGPPRGVFDSPTVLERVPHGALGEAKRVAPGRVGKNAS